MPKRSNSTANSAIDHLSTPLRRSQRLLQVTRDLNPNPSKTPAQKPSNQKKKVSDSSSIPLSERRRSPRLSSKPEEISIPRRSPRISKPNSEIGSKKLGIFGLVESTGNKGLFSTKVKRRARLASCDQIAKKSGRWTRCDEIRSKKHGYSASVESKKNKGGFSDTVKGKESEIVQKSERRTRFCSKSGVVIGLQAENRRDVSEGNQKTRKRKRGEEEAKKECVEGWTKEQEMALQRAYIVAKPTPNFWKQVSKMVPGKSAKECFDRVHSDHITPTQPLPRSRAKNIGSSPLGKFSLSPGKLLEPSNVKVEKLSRYKTKSHIAHKTVRELLQKQNQLDLNHEADLFTVLEPNRNPSDPNNVVSTPKKLLEKQGFLQQCGERSGQTKGSRFGASSEANIISPPVLKQVKNRVLHEKYIDRLHCREAKRKSVCGAGKENKSRANVATTEIVRAAKNALVSDAANAINKLQHLEANPNDGDDDLDMDEDDEIDGL